MAAHTARARRFGSPAHLAGRFFGALSPAGPLAQDERWALAQLRPGERALWGRMSGPDRRHAVAVARTAAAMLARDGASPAREVLAAALLHDVGKISSRLGTLGRVAVTLASVVPGGRLLSGSGAAQRYLAHDRIGGELLREAGSDELTIAWAEQHHLPPERWTIDPRIGEALKDADAS